MATRKPAKATKSKAPAPGGFLHIAQRVFDTPLLIHQQKLDTILRVLGPRIGFDMQSEPLQPLAHRTPEAHGDALQMMLSQIQMASARPRVEFHDEGYYSVGRLAIVPVVGSLIQRSDWLAESSGMMSYARIERAFAAAVNDPDVEEIILEVDSPGGEVAGAFALADRIYEARASKPIIGIATEFAASAGFLLLSSASEIVVPRTGAVGSVGVVAAHMDNSAALEKKGVAVTLIYAGDKKVDGNPYEPLSDRARADWQRDIDSIYSLFVETVARNRGMTTDAVRETQAGIFMGEDAVRVGFANRVGSYAQEVQQSLSRPGGTLRLIESPQKEASMSQTTGGASTTTAAASTTAAAPAAAPAAAAPAAAASPSAADERARVKAITTHAEAAGRDALAQHLAFETDMSVDQAVAMLKVSPKAAAAAPAAAAAAGSPGELRAAMAQNGTPGIRADERPAAAADDGKVVNIDTHGIYRKREEARAGRMGRFSTGTRRED